MEKLSHAYIISSPSKELCIKLATELAEKSLCGAAGKRPCGVCRDCRKVLNGTHPDFIRISRLSDDKGRLKKELQVDQIRSMAADAYVLPNEAAEKVYLIEDADTMNESAQNAALKLLEEPPKGVRFILCVQNPEKLLVTVRSRCVEIHRNAEAEAPDADAKRMAEEFISCIQRGSRSGLLTWCMASEGCDGRKTADFLEAAKAELISALSGEGKRLSMSGEEIMRLIALCDRCLDRLKVNTGTKHIYGLLAVKGIEEKS